MGAQVAKAEKQINFQLTVATVSVSNEAPIVVGKINKQLSEFEEEISQRQKHDSNVGAMVEDSYRILNTNHVS